MGLTIMNNYATGISLLTFIINCHCNHVVLSIRIPAGSKCKTPRIPKEVLEPAERENVAIIEGSAQPSQTRNFENQKKLRGIMGICNRITMDSTPLMT